MKKQILIIDDDSDLLEAIKERLSVHDFWCVTAASAEIGLQKASRLKPDMVLLDLNMPNMSGFGCLREFKHNPNLSKIPVVILSGLSDEEIVREGMNLGAAGYLNKTCGTRVMVETIKHYSGGELIA